MVSAKAVNIIEGKSASFLFDFTPILSDILDQQEKTGQSIRSLRAVIGIDVAETIERYQDVSGGGFYCMFGQTETSCLATVGAYNDRPGAAGRTIQLGDLRLVDNDDRPVPAGQTGEIVLRGPMVFQGYWNLPDDNAYTFRNGWHHTGDLGKLDEDGFLWYAGRKAEKELIKPGGENVYPKEVEDVIYTHPAVRECTVVSSPSEGWGEIVRAIVVLKPGMSATEQEIIDHCKRTLAGYKCPKAVSLS